jgi:hypothetical protein
MMADYKSHELNLYSNNSVGRLKFEDGKGTGKGPGFGTNQEYIFAKYTDAATGSYQWPVCIPELFTIDNSTGYVLNIGWTIADEQKKLTDEKTRALGVEAGLRTDVEAYHAADSKAVVDEAKLRTDADSAEAKARSDADTAEAKARTDADAFLQTQVGALWGGLQTIEADSKTRDTALDGKLGVERTRALDAEAVVQASVNAEAARALSAEGKLSDRIDFISSNTNPAALDSLTELVAHFNGNGAGYASRLEYLEAVVAALVAKTQ